jgi:predicted phosphodiesterase
MRIAILSDIHGNTPALDAVLNDIRERGGADAYWVLGDLAAIGADPVGALQRVANLPEACFVHGNCDRYLVTGERPGPALEDAQRDSRLIRYVAEVASSFSWTQGALTVSRWLPWLEGIPLEYRTALPDGTRVLCVHAAPGQDDGWGIHPALSQQELASVLAGCEADLVCVGHTHWPLQLEVDGVRVVNVGSVSNPFPPDLRACYTLLEADASGYRLEQRRVDYDREAAIAGLERVRHPARRFIARWLQGGLKPRWGAEVHEPRRE